MYKMVMYNVIKYLRSQARLIIVAISRKSAARGRQSAVTWPREGQ